LALSIFAFVTIVPVANADPAKPVRIIQITKENAERSAAEMSAAKSPRIGEPPPGRIIRAPSDWRNSRAQSLDNEAAPAPQDILTDPAPATFRTEAPDQAVVQIIRPGKTGFVVETHVVPRHNSARGL
jgi:hypothetical protein